MDLSELLRQDNRGFKRHPWEIARARVIYFLLRPYQAGIDNIADIGSGDGYIPQQLYKNGVQRKFFAVDTGYVPEIVAQLQTNLAGVNIQWLNSRAELEQQDDKINLFLFLDVLEHCKNDTEVLRSYVRSSSAERESLFLITVPAFRGLSSVHDTLLGHYRRYNKRAIETLCKNENLTILKSGYFFCSLLPFRWLQSLLEKIALRKPDKSIDNWKAPGIVSKLFLAILWLDFRIGYSLSRLGINLPGLSCYCICQKSPS